MEKIRAERRTYEFLKEEELNMIEEICNEIRKSHDSKKNMVYIVSSFAEFCKGELFNVSDDQVEAYLSFLKEGVVNKRFKEQYCACIFLELRAFYDRAALLGYVMESPFTGMENPFKFQTKLDMSDVPSLSEVDHLLTLCDSNPTLKLFVLLAFRMGLTISEMVGLEKKNFIFNVEDGRTYLKIWRHIDGVQKEAYLLVPGDLISYISNMASSTSKDFPYLFRNQKGRPFAVRTVQQLLGWLQEGEKKVITLSQLRSLFIYLMLVKRVPMDKITAYTNVRGDWFFKYESIPKELIFDAAEYVNIKVV